jgi:hypothetical protein
MSELTPEELRKIFIYDEATGKLFWREAAGSDDSHGYSRIKVRGRSYRAHRIAWAIKYGVWPAGIIDHVDGDRKNNAVSNLREATHSANARNKNGHARSGLKGVYQETRGTRRVFWSSITSNGQTTHLGSFDCPAAASFAYQIASEIHHQRFAPAATKLFAAAN